MSSVIRPIDAQSPSEVALVAERMRKTLIEVLGKERAVAMYSMDWLRDRVRFHLDPSRSTGEVFVAEDVDGSITGHTITRIEREQDGRQVGLFSTTYVAPAHRRSGVAKMLLRQGETWMRERGLRYAVTYTSESNVKLIHLYGKHGYRIVDARSEMVKLEKALAS